MKNKIYINKEDKPKNNNQKIYSINKEIKNKIDITSKINHLVNENGYLFNKNIEIITKDHIYHTSIASILEDKIITMDKDVIRINDILDINRI